jgi:hemerythrin
VPDEERRTTEGKLVQEVRAEHRRLDQVFAELGRALREGGDLDALRDDFAALAEQVDVHFEQEDRLYYASIGALRPELKPEIEAIALAHDRFRLELSRISDQLERAALERARLAFAQLVGAFEQHEAAEESLLRRLDRETAGAI